MIKKNYFKNTIINNIFSIKFFFRVFAIIAVLLLGIVTTIITYKTIVDVWSFFHLGHLTSIKLYKTINFIIGLLIGTATVIQSYSAIWDRLSYWGQCVDNFIIKRLTGKTYFLEEVNEALQFIRKLVNQINFQFQQYYWETDIQQKSTNNKYIVLKLETLLKHNTAQAIQLYHKVIKLLKDNECCDNINKERKDEADELLNSLIAQLADNTKQINEFIKQIKNP